MTSPLTCTNCGEQIHVEQRTAAGLVLTCDCEMNRSVKVATALPTTWEEAPQRTL